MYKANKVTSKNTSIACETILKKSYPIQKYNGLETTLTLQTSLHSTEQQLNIILTTTKQHKQNSNKKHERPNSKQHPRKRQR